MNSPHQIDYDNLPAARANDSVAARNCVSFCERDFLTQAKIPPLHKVLPPALIMPDQGLIDFSKELGVAWPATMPDLLAGNVMVAAGDTTRLPSRGSSAAASHRRKNSADQRFRR